LIGELRAFFVLNGQVAYWIFVAPFRGKPVRLSAVVQQMVRIGVQAIPMTALTSFSIGLTLAMQAGGELARMGATDLVPQLIGMSLLRELGPLLVGVVVIGRSGSAVTAEIGTMKVSEEIEALEAMAINPVRYLVVPRFIAMLIMLPVITVFGIYIGIVGGWTICHFALGMASELYIIRIIESVDLVDLWSGMLKSLVFAWLIIGIACETGLSVRGGAEGVGMATTQSVVKAIIAMLIANALLTAGFFVFDR
jgi:phospholipid/cholesterol/gamma-HCH transport system permease protein